MAGGELELIRWMREEVGTAAWPVVLGIGDDMAMVEIGGDRPDAGEAVFLTSDMLLDGVHFETGKHSLEAIGRKAIACSLSDCAAMAVRPVAATVSVAYPQGTDLDDAKRLFRAMRAMAGQFDCHIVGGDTTSWQGALAIDVAMIASRYPGHQAIRRCGARVGDTLYVTGTLGGSRLGKHIEFVPRINEAHSIASATHNHLHAMMDITDGLAIDLSRMCSESGVGAELVEGLLDRVISPAAREMADIDGRSPLDHALHDGEDFELLLAVAGDAPVPPTLQDAYLYPVGVVLEEGLFLKRRDGSRDAIEARGYEHLT